MKRSTPRVGQVATGAAAADSDWRSYPPLVLDQPLQAALSAFLEFGYHGATMREIAQRAGLSVPGVYHYFASKQDMLVAILDLTMHDLLARSRAARAEGKDPVTRFALLVECLALFHTHRRELGFVGASEMRSLVPAQRRRVAAARRTQQRMVDEEVEKACASGAFVTPRSHEASRAVVTMCTALPQWYEPAGEATGERGPCAPLSCPGEDGARSSTKSAKPETPRRSRSGTRSPLRFHWSRRTVAPDRCGLEDCNRAKRAISYDTQLSLSERLSRVLDATTRGGSS